MSFLVIEEILDSRNPDLSRHYRLCKQKIMDRYPFVHASFPGANDHGPGHIKRVIKYLNVLSNIELQPELLNDAEIYILLLSTLFHDIGNLSRRDGHERLSADYVKAQLSGEYTSCSEANLDAVCKVIECHSSIIAIEDVIHTSRDVLGIGIEARLQLLAALLRLADECDETVERAPKDVYQQLVNAGNMPEESKVYWRFNQTVQTILPRPDSRDIYVKVVCHDDEHHEVYQMDEGKRVLLGYTINRINKLNKERQYCNGFLRTEGLIYDKVIFEVHLEPSNVRLVEELDDRTESAQLVNTFLPHLLSQYLPPDIPLKRAFLHDLQLLLGEAFDDSLRSVILFGSAGSSLQDNPDGNLDDIRDLDVMVIFNDGRLKYRDTVLSEISRLLTLRYSISFSLESICISDFLSLLSIGDGFVISVITDGTPLYDDGAFHDHQILLQSGDFNYPKKRLIDYYEKSISTDLVTTKAAATEGDKVRCFTNAYSAITKRLQIARLQMIDGDSFTERDAYSLSKLPSEISPDFTKKNNLPNSFSEVYKGVHRRFKDVSMSHPQLGDPTELQKLASNVENVCRQQKRGKE